MDSTALSGPRAMDLADTASNGGAASSPSTPPGEERLPEGFSNEGENADQNGNREQPESTPTRGSADAGPSATFPVDAGPPNETDAAGGTPPSDDAGASPNSADADLPSPPTQECGTATRSPSGRCYQVTETPLSWASAREACNALGAGWDLASIRSIEDNLFVSALSTEQLWLGGTDLGSEGSWRWVNDDSPFWEGDGATGQPVDGAYSNWNGDEPNGSAGSGCARIVPTANGIWGDLECEFERLAVCEGPAAPSE